MKALGIVRKIDDLGRIVIPKEVRKSQGWEDFQPMEMFMDGDKLVIQAYGKDRENQEMITQLETAATLTDNPAVKAVLQSTIDFIKKG
ncbi:AbrB/MazE/SpoVT family DNA-binding domain-containing protein [Peribacillus frigoritolerans]|uniref:AbrB/MazE/SpoVT family DNA-binding domain-containing protein n=1 Tax=Peribacillus frigoritolerans TaxID=450367 RepID=UPI003D034146